MESESPLVRNRNFQPFPGSWARSMSARNASSTRAPVASSSVGSRSARGAICNRVVDEPPGGLVLGEVGQPGPGEVTAGGPRGGLDAVGDLRLSERFPQVCLLLGVGERVNGQSLTLQHQRQRRHRLLIRQRGDPVCDRK